MNNRSTDHKELSPKESVRMREATGSAAEVKTVIRTSEVLNSPSPLSLDSFTINLPTQIELGISSSTMKRVDEEPTPKAIDNALSQDPLHRKREIEDFLKMLITVEPPYTFVIDAPWGSGKTFFVKQVARVLQMANPTLNHDFETLNATLGETATELPATPCLPIYFNAWEDDHFDNPIVPILASIANAVDEQSVKGGKDFGKGVISVIETAASIIGYDVDINGIIENFIGTDFLEQYKAEKSLGAKLASS